MRRNWPLVALLLLFLLPLFGALFLLGTPALKFTTVQHGKLLSQPKPLQVSALTSLDEFNSSNTYTNAWQLIYVTPERCTHACIQRKQQLRNLQAALGAKRQRLKLAIANAKHFYPQQDAESILLLNPDGLYIMYYARDTDASKILKDVKRLLKYSHG